MTFCSQFCQLPLEAVPTARKHKWTKCIWNLLVAHIIEPTTCSPISFGVVLVIVRLIIYGSSMYASALMNHDVFCFYSSHFRRAKLATCSTAGSSGTHSLAGHHYSMIVACPLLLSFLTAQKCGTRESAKKSRHDGT